MTTTKTEKQRLEDLLEDARGSLAGWQTVMDCLQDGASSREVNHLRGNFESVTHFIKKQMLSPQQDILQLETMLTQITANKHNDGVRRNVGSSLSSERDGMCSGYPPPPPEHWLEREFNS